MNKPIRRWMVFLVCIAFAGQLLVGCSAKSQGVKTDRSDKKQLKIGFTIDIFWFWKGGPETGMYLPQ